MPGETQKGTPVHGSPSFGDPHTGISNFGDPSPPPHPPGMYGFLRISMLDYVDKCQHLHRGDRFKILG